MLAGSSVCMCMCVFEREREKERERRKTDLLFATCVYMYTFMYVCEAFQFCTKFAIFSHKVSLNV